jgi:hypothetical protein
LLKLLKRNRYNSWDRDRRSHLRLDFDCPVRWTDGGVDRPGRARDVSPFDAGFTVRRLSAPEVGQDISLTFELEPDRDWLVSPRAKVTRCDLREDGLFDVGVELRAAALD